MTATKPHLIIEPYSAYYHRDIPKEDEELTHVGPGTPCGELFRRFWNPVALSEELKDLPVARKLLDEELVIFRDGSGQVGLLELHCSHRGTSLEFGLIEQKGIRCCYHGWQYDVDGRILDTPGEPPDSTYKERLCHGAYPVLECEGMVWAYMGPPDKKPPFPTYDTFYMPGYRLGVRKSTRPCNWLQAEDNIMDPVHLTTLHTRSSGTQFLMEDGRPSHEFGGFAELDWMETPTGGMVYLSTRRVGEDVWVRMGEWMPPAHQIIPAHPNFPPSYPEGTQEMYVRPKYTAWQMPIDDTNTATFSFVHIPESEKGPVRTTNTASLFKGERPYEERQRFPGDYEAQMGQRPIAIHALEHLVTTDRGVTMFRKLVRQGIRAVKNGQDPEGLVREEGKIVPSYGCDTVMRVPLASTPEEDKELLRETGRKVATKYFKSPLVLSGQR